MFSARHASADSQSGVRRISDLGPSLSPSPHAPQGLGDYLALPPSPPPGLDSTSFSFSRILEFKQILLCYQDRILSLDKYGITYFVKHKMLYAC